MLAERFCEFQHQGYSIWDPDGGGGWNWQIGRTPPLIFFADSLHILIFLADPPSTHTFHYAHLRIPKWNSPKLQFHISGAQPPRTFYQCEFTENSEVYMTVFPTVFGKIFKSKVLPAFFRFVAISFCWAIGKRISDWTPITITGHLTRLNAESMSPNVSLRSNKSNACEKEN